MKTEDEIYADLGMTFSEIYAVVKGKIANKVPMTTAREELMERFLQDWAECFGADTI